METPVITSPQAQLYYDGECDFCAACARFIARFDTKKRIQLHPLQGSDHNRADGCYDSILFIKGDKQSQFSTAVVDVLKDMGGFWWVLGVLIWLIPRPVRDYLYRFVGARRHWITGKKPTC